MESPYNPKTREELHEELDRLLTRADENGLLGDVTTTYTLMHDNPEALTELSETAP